MRQKLSFAVSKSQLSRDIKGAGLKRKRIKKKPSARQTSSNQNSRLEFATYASAKRNKNFLVLDESEFSLHTSINYGYALVNEDSIMFQQISKGKNISLCMINSIDGVKQWWAN